MCNALDDVCHIDYNMSHIAYEQMPAYNDFDDRIFSEIDTLIFQIYDITSRESYIN